MTTMTNSDHISVPPVLTQRDRLMRLLEGDGTPPDGCGYAFDGIADVSYTANGRSYWIEIRDLTEAAPPAPWGAIAEAIAKAETTAPGPDPHSAARPGV
jgi:hypothetical protein